MDRSSRNRLTARLLPLFPGDTLFARVARAVCRAECLPRKELYESWEVARRVRRRCRGGRVVDLACGHGLLAQLLVLLDDTTREALAVDRSIPASARKLAASLEESWPRLAGRVRFVEGELEEVPLYPDDLVVSVHACGGLTDRVLDRATAVGARVAVLPCCHDLDGADRGGPNCWLGGWVDGPLAMDIQRAVRVRSRGYRVFTQQIPSDITPKSRLLIAEPLGAAARAP
jgi:SAM-dependent methyltransferase